MVVRPQMRILAECARRGRREVVAACAAVLMGGPPDPALLVVLGGPPAVQMLRGQSQADLETWSRVWAARGLLWALEESCVPDAAPALVAALRDRAWRVREKAAQTVARHLVDAALEELLGIAASDPVPRVRRAAQRALQRLTCT